MGWMQVEGQYLGRCIGILPGLASGRGTREVNSRMVNEHSQMRFGIGDIKDTYPSLLERGWEDRAMYRRSAGSPQSSTRYTRMAPWSYSVSALSNVANYLQTFSPMYSDRPLRQSILCAIRTESSRIIARIS